MDFCVSAGHPPLFRKNVTGRKISLQFLQGFSVKTLLARLYCTVHTCTFYTPSGIADGFLAFRPAMNSGETAIMSFLSRRANLWHGCFLLVVYPSVSYCIMPQSCTSGWLHRASLSTVAGNA